MPRIQFPVLFAILCAASASAQTPSAPPMKMGLWETTVTSQVSGFQLPPDVVARLKSMGRSVPGGPHTMVSQGCLTPQEWQKDMEQMNAPANKDCTITHRVTDAKSISIDISCKTDNGMTSSGHWEMHMIDKEHGHGSGSMKGDAAGPNGQSFAVTMTMDTRYVSADCGDVKPGASKVIKQD